MHQQVVSIRKLTGLLLTLSVLQGAGASAAIQVEPSVLDYGLMKPETQLEQTLKLTNTGDLPVLVTAITADCPTCTKFTFEPTEIAPHKELKLPVTYAPRRLDLGAQHKFLTIRTSDKKQAEFKVAINVDVTLSGGVVPNKLQFSGPQAPASDVAEELQLLNVSDQPIKLLYATGPLDGPHLSFSREAVPAGGKATIKAKWHLPEKTGPISGQIVLYVDHTELTKFVIPYQAQVAIPATQPTSIPSTVPSISPITTPSMMPGSTLPGASSTTIPATRTAPPTTSSTASQPSDVSSATAPVTTTKPVATINLDLKDSVPLRDLVEIVASQLKLNLVYDDSALNVPVSLRLSGPLPVDALLPLLKSILQSKGLALVTTERPEIWRIVTSREAQGLAEPGAVGGVGGPDQVVSELIKPQSMDLETAAGLLRSFATNGTGQISTLPNSKLLIITDYAPQVARLKRLLELIDKPQPAADLEIVALSAAEPGPLSDKLTKLLAQIAKAEGRSDLDKIFISPAEDTRGLTIVGPASQLARIRELIKKLDVAPSLVRVDYPLVESQRTAALETIRQILGNTATETTHDGLPRIMAAPQRVAVLATEGQHRRIKELLGQQDTPDASAAVQLKVYVIQNRPAAEIQGTLSRLLNDMKTGNVSLEITSPSQPKDWSPMTTEGITSVGSPIPPGPEHQNPKEAVVNHGVANPYSVASNGNINVTIDEGTNTLLIAASGEMHKKLKVLIEQLDRKQAQVLLEVMLISVADGDTLAYAVEAAVKGHFAGSTIGIGTDAGIGSGNFVDGRTPGVGQGLNAAIFNPASFSFFLRALENTNKARITSFPQVLAMDNKAAMVRSTEQQPYTSVNASSTVATTSLGGYAEAGTTLELTPHIAPADYLNLEYRLEVSSFTGSSTSSGGSSIPPPRRSDSISSFVSVPDGSTVIVGGLAASTDTKSVAKVPGLGDIPLLGLLGSNTNNAKINTTFYVFVRPTILRAARFEDLKFISEGQRQSAQVGGDFPESALRYMQ